MRLVTTMMTTKKITAQQLQEAKTILMNKFKCKAETFQHNYGERQYFETDIDLLDVEFTKESLYDELNKLIYAYEEIMSRIPLQVDFIAANDDTETEILRYEKDINDIKDFGLFVTTRTIPALKPYYSSKFCNAYVNLTFVSFGVYD